MKFFLTLQNTYYEGDREHLSDIEVLQRPDFTYDWDGIQWNKNPAKEPKPIPKKQDLDTEIDAIRTIDDIKAFLKIRITERVTPIAIVEVTSVTDRI